MPVPLTDRSLAGLRATAAALVAVPTLRARVVHDDTTILEVERPPFDDDRPHPVLAPCAFHGAVARAHRLRRHGEQLAMRGLPAGAEPSIRWGVRPGDLALPGSILRVRGGGSWLHVAAVASPLETCAAAVAGSDGGPPGLGYHRDDAVDATLLHLITPVGDDGASAEALTALEIAVARVSVHELVEHLGVTAPDTAARLG